MGRFLKKLIALGCLVCILLAAGFDVLQSRSGNANSIGSIVTPETRHFILLEFGSAVGPKDLAYKVLDFSLRNFTYDDETVGFFQSADTNRFIFQKDFHGVCLDFAAFVKTVFCVIAEEKGWEHVGCYVALGIGLRPRGGHALNYITVENPDGTVTIYELDTTWDLGRYQSHQLLQELSYSVVAESPQQVEDKIHEAFDSYYQYSLMFLK